MGGKGVINGNAIFRLACLLLLVLTACRQQVAQGPFVQATATATLRSTPLPQVATVVPPGTEENPIQMVLHPGGVVTAAQTSAFETALREQSNLAVNVVVVERHAEALAALCASSPTSITVAWLDGITLQAAIAQNCGEPVMVVERDGSSGNPGQIIASEAISSVPSLGGRSFCRLGVNDYYSWLVPSLLMQTNGVDPVNGLQTVTDFDSRNELIQAVIDGDCDATGISETDFDDLRAVQRDQLTVLDSTPPLPFAVLMYPLSLPLGERIRLENALTTLELDADGSAAMRPLLGQDGLAAVDDGDFDSLADFLRDTGLDFAQLGR
jgi:ABC-type phosphate/phosphonate transport system substrate-binding protein